MLWLTKVGDGLVRGWYLPNNRIAYTIVLSYGSIIFRGKLQAMFSYIHVTNSAAHPRNNDDVKGEIEIESYLLLLAGTTHNQAKPPNQTKRKAPHPRPSIRRIDDLKSVSFNSQVIRIEWIVINLIQGVAAAQEQDSFPFQSIASTTNTRKYK